MSYIDQLQDIALSYVAFRAHVNLGGESSRFVRSHVGMCQLFLRHDGMVKIERNGEVHYVGAALIESCEEDVGYDARISAAGATVTEPVAEPTTEPEPTPEPQYTEEPPKRGKRAQTDAGAISRAEEILKEFGK